MGYRNEQDGLRAQVTDLRDQLAHANLTIERLTGNAPPPQSGEVIERSRLLDAPSRVVLERELDFEIGDEGFEAIAALLRPKVGAVAQVGRTLTANGFSLACADGATKVRMVGDFRDIAPVAVSASVFLGAFAAFVTFAIDFVDRNLAEGNFLWMAPLFIAGVFVFVRQLSRRSAHTKAKQQRATLEAVVEVAQRFAKKRPAAGKARVAVSASISEDAAAETEAAAEAEAAEADAEATAERERIAAREP